MKIQEERWILLWIREVNLTFSKKVSLNWDCPHLPSSAKWRFHFRLLSPRTQSPLFPSSQPEGFVPGVTGLEWFSSCPSCLSLRLSPTPTHGMRALPWVRYAENTEALIAFSPSWEVVVPSSDRQAKRTSGCCLSPPSMSSQLLEWKCPLKRSLPLSPLPASELVKGGREPCKYCSHPRVPGHAQSCTFLRSIIGSVSVTLEEK